MLVILCAILSCNSHFSHSTVGLCSTDMGTNMTHTGKQPVLIKGQGDKPSYVWDMCLQCHFSFLTCNMALSCRLQVHQISCGLQVHQRFKSIKFPFFSFFFRKWQFPFPEERAIKKKSPSQVEGKFPRQPVSNLIT